MGRRCDLETVCFSPRYEARPRPPSLRSPLAPPRPLPPPTAAPRSPERVGPPPPPLRPRPPRSRRGCVVRAQRFFGHHAASRSTRRTTPAAPRTPAPTADGAPCTTPTLRPSPTPPTLPILHLLLHLPPPFPSTPAWPPPPPPPRPAHPRAATFGVVMYFFLQYMCHLWTPRRPRTRLENSETGRGAPPPRPPRGRGEAARAAPRRTPRFCDLSARAELSVFISYLKTGKHSQTTVPPPPGKRGERETT